MQFACDAVAQGRELFPVTLIKLPWRFGLCVGVPFLFSRGFGQVLMANCAKPPKTELSSVWTVEGAYAEQPSWSWRCWRQ